MTRIAVVAVPRCPICGGGGDPLHAAIPDRVFTDRDQTWSVWKCRDGACGVLWLNPMPTREEIGKAYGAGYYTHAGEEPPSTWLRRAYQPVKEGYLASRYGYRRTTTPGWKRALGAALWLHPGRRSTLDYGVMHLHGVAGGRLLEVGCGAGRMLASLRALGWEVEGVDADPAAVQRGRERGLAIHLGDLESRRFEDGRFDAVLMSHVIEHVHDPRRLLAECRRVLRPGGALVVLTPNPDSLGHRVFADRWFALEVPRHLMLFPVPTLKRMVEEAGFTVRRLATTPRGGRRLWAASRRIGRDGTAGFDGERLAPRGGRAARAWERVGGLAFEARAWIRIAAGQRAGEETLLLAKRA